MEDFLTEKTSSLSPIGFVCRALDKIVEVSKGMFPGIYALDQCEFVFRIQNVCNDIPGGGGHLPAIFVPTPGTMYLPFKTKKMLMPGD